jgi:hypothetical protein
MVFENARALAASQGFGLQAAKCTQSYIRTEVAVTNSTAQYQLPILVSAANSSTNATRVLNKFLNLQDLFYVSEIGFFLTVASGTAVNGKLYSYPNKTAFPTGATSLNAVYNGQLSITINNEQVLPAWDVNRSFIIKQTQQNTNFNVAAPTAPAQFVEDELDLSTDGFYPCEPGIILNGAANIQATLTLPGAVATVDANTAIVTVFRGILIQNATTVR